jgi:hypothetical protein
MMVALSPRDADVMSPQPALPRAPVDVTVPSSWNSTVW